MWIGGGVGSVGASLGITAGIIGGLGIAALPIGLAALTVVGGGMLGIYRMTFRWGLTRARRELEHLLDAVSAHARSQDVFGVPAQSPLGRTPNRAPMLEDPDPLG